ncbi:hypothetical protein ATC03_10605 [Agromyces aureus]|uniref:Uncharacterized protein n=2 Tax=Agromyces aureus TaxID=453304 RepID=A0A191WFS7_9MICO|nr:hypothetical protein ATC03_10605 [Agromyces aureus]
MKIDGREYLLPADHDPETVMANITGLVRAGGGFVEAMRSPDRTVSVFVSPGMSLSVEVTDVDGDVLEHSDSDEPWLPPSALDPFDLQ